MAKTPLSFGYSEYNRVNIVTNQHCWKGYINNDLNKIELEVWGIRLLEHQILQIAQVIWMKEENVTWSVKFGRVCLQAACIYRTAI